MSNMKLVPLIPIKDMDRALKFYRIKLGCKLKQRARGKMRNFWASLRLGNNEIWLVRPEKEEKIELAYNCFITKEIEDSVKKLRSKNVRFQKAPRGMGGKIREPILYTEHGAMAFFKDSEGNLLMLYKA